MCFLFRLIYIFVEPKRGFIIIRSTSVVQSAADMWIDRAGLSLVLRLNAEL